MKRSYIIDEWVKVNKVPSAFSLVIAGGWMMAAVSLYPSLWYISAVGASSIVLGVWYFFI